MLTRCLEISSELRNDNKGKVTDKWGAGVGLSRQGRCPDPPQQLASEEKEEEVEKEECHLEQRGSLNS